ncbi:MAG: ABC transporter ATP-binding protein [Bacteroidales bacterium]
MVKVCNITKKFSDLTVLKGISLCVNKSEIVSIVGTSGAGKTTLLEIMGTLSSPTSGEVLINGINVCKLNTTELATIRNQQIGFVFQFHHLLPEFTALENVCIPAFIAGVDKTKAEKRAKELLTFLNLSHRLHHKPSQMSGGEQQRVAITRALINKPSIMLADEPSGNLDARNKEELHALLLLLRKEFGQTIIIVTHDESFANACDRKIVLHDGLIV